MIKLITNQDLKAVLMEQGSRSAKVAYYLIAAEDQIIFAVLSGRNGEEFNKTPGHFNNLGGLQTYHCLYGSGILLMQRIDESGEAKEFKVVTLNAGRQVGIPAGW